MSKPLQISFDDKGNLISRVRGWRAPTMKTEENSVFDDKLEYVSYLSYDSPKMKFKSLNSGREYVMFLSDFDDVLQGKLFVNNVVESKFTFCKKGMSQGIKLFKEKKRS